MKTIVIDSETIKGDLKFDGRVEFTRSCEITGSLVAGAVAACADITVHKSYTVHTNDFVGGSQTVGWNQYVGWRQTVGWWQNVGEEQDVGCWQNVGGNQDVGGNQSVSGWQSVSGRQSVGGNQTVGGEITCREYINLSFQPIDAKKISATIIRFCNTYYAERRFWAAQFHTIPDFAKFIMNETNCFEEIISEGRKYKAAILSGEYIPAVRQAIEMHLK